VFIDRIDGMEKIILFGPLFTQAERVWNRLLKSAIEKAGRGKFEVILPQEEAKKFIKKNKIDIDAIVQSCLNNAGSMPIAVAILDGPDADSGTCIEIGFRKGRDRKLPVVGVRTDFRVSEDGGLNAMLRICDKIIYFPSFNTDIDALAQKILAEINKLGRPV